MRGRPRTVNLRPDDLLSREQAKTVARFMAKRDTVPLTIPDVVCEHPGCDLQRLQRQARLRAHRILAERAPRARTPKAEAWLNDPNLVS